VIGVGLTAAIQRIAPIAIPQFAENDRDMWLRVGQDFFLIEPFIDPLMTSFITSQPSDLKGWWARQEATSACSADVSNAIQLLPLPKNQAGNSGKTDLGAWVEAMHQLEAENFQRLVAANNPGNSVHAALDLRPYEAEIESRWRTAKMTIMSELNRHAIDYQDIKTSPNRASVRCQSSYFGGATR
jgi:hypothetical protein